MPSPTIPATKTSVYTTEPHAIICGPHSVFVERLSVFLRNQGVAITVEKDLHPIADAEYAIYIGDWISVKSIIASQKHTATKTLCVVTDGFTRACEISADIKNYPRTKAVLSSESDVPHLQVDTVLSFFFGSLYQRILQPLQMTPSVSLEKIDHRADHTVPEVITEKTSTADSGQRTTEDAIASTVAAIYGESAPSSVQEGHHVYDSPIYTHATALFATVGRIMVVLVFGFLLFVGYPLVSFAGNSVIALWRLQSAYKAAVASDITTGTKRFDQASSHITSAQTELSHLSWLFSLGNAPELMSFFSRTLSVAQHIALGGQQALDGIAVGRDIPLYVTGTGSQGLAQTITQTKQHLSLANNNLAVAEAEGKLLFAAYPKASLLFLQQNQFATSLERLAQARRGLTIGNGFLSLLPELTGLSGKRNYLVLFLNNMELRPGGGFIGSFGLVSFDQGRMGKLRIEDVYAADGQLKGHVDPPFAVSTFLGQENFFLRDSNWDPDFSVSAPKAAWFLQKELGIPVDGVIALDLTAAAYILSATGPITIPDYDQQITSDNLFLQAQTYAQTDFFPGSTQKKDFLGSLGRALLTQLTDTEQLQSSQTALLQKVSQALEEKHILVYFNDSKTQHLTKNLGFGGTIIQGQCVVEACMHDYLYVVDANVGVNKANYYIKRAITNVVAIASDATITRDVIMLYGNDSPKAQSFPGGTYRNYVRVLVPLGSTVSKVAIDGKKAVRTNKDTFKRSSDAPLTYFVDQYHDKTTVEIYFEVPPESERRITVSYKLPNSLSVSERDGALYNLTVQKQPGTDGDFFRTIVEYPPHFRLVSSGEMNVAGASTLAKEGRLEYNDRLTHDMHVQLRFAE